MRSMDYSGMGVRLQYSVGNCINGEVGQVDRDGMDMQQLRAPQVEGYG